MPNHFGPWWGFPFAEDTRTGPSCRGGPPGGVNPMGRNGQYLLVEDKMHSTGESSPRLCAGPSVPEQGISMNAIRATVIRVASRRMYQSTGQTGPLC